MDSFSFFSNTKGLGLTVVLLTKVVATPNPDKYNAKMFSGHYTVKGEIVHGFKKMPKMDKIEYKPGEMKTFYEVPESAIRQGSYSISDAVA